MTAMRYGVLDGHVEVFILLMGEIFERRLENHRLQMLGDLIDKSTGVIGLDQYPPTVG